MLFGVIMVALWLFPLSTSAATFGDARGTFSTAGKAIYGANPPSLQVTAIRVIRSGLSLLGIIFLVLILYAGFLWMTAQGDEKQVTRAKDTIEQAAIGLGIIIASYTITTFVGNALSSAVK